MKLFFYRHLPTNNNLNNVFIGRLDLDCNDSYIETHQNEIANTFENLSFNKIFCSPLKRATQSAEIFFPDKAYTIDRRLIERDLGDWKNQPKANVRANYPKAFFPNGNMDFNYTPPNGEPFESVLKRISSFVLDLHNNYSEQDNIAIVTHNGILTAVRCLLSNSTSTETIKPYPYFKEFIVEITPSFLDCLECEFSNFKNNRKD